MTVKEFKKWLIENDHTQKTLADRLKIHHNTVSGYVRNERFPFTFVLSLVAIERGLSGDNLGEKL